MIHFKIPLAFVSKRKVTTGAKPDRCLFRSEGTYVNTAVKADPKYALRSLRLLLTRANNVSMIVLTLLKMVLQSHLTFF